MGAGIGLAFVVALCTGVWTVSHQLASQHINLIFGAILISLTAVALGLLFLLPQLKQVTLYSHPKGILWACIAGVLAFAIDYFTLKAYTTGASISVIAPIIIGGGVLCSSLIGFTLGEPVTGLKLVSIGLIFIGASLLSYSASPA